MDLIFKALISLSPNTINYFLQQTDEKLPSKCIDQNAKDSLKKTLTFNFGSMCWGSLITPYIENVNQVINPDGDLDTGITECFPRKCVDGFEKATRNFTQWGFIYVGMYGYGYNDSCRRVANLFKDRGWLNASNDHTLRNIFLLSSVIIAFAMGEIGKTVGNNTDWFDKQDAEFEARM